MLQWQNGRRGQDGWGRWTRRRKWYRDAELVEADAETGGTPTPPSFKSQPEDSTPGPPPALRATRASPTLSASTSSPVDSQIGAVLAPDDAPDEGKARDRTEEDDTLSVLSSSSRSTRFRMPSLRRRVTDSSASSTAAAAAAAAAAVPATTTAAHATGSSSRRRRASSAASDEDAAVLGTQLELEIQGAGKEGWGIGDDARMGLE